MLLIIGLTGGIASGKSTVSKMFKELGVPVFDADLTAHRLLEKNGVAYKEVVDRFVGKDGYDILSEDSSIDRKKLGSVVFSNTELLRCLESIMHHHVEKSMIDFFDGAKKQGLPVVVADVPLLIEKKWYKKVDEVWLVYVPLEIQVQRLISRDGYTEKEVIERISAQLPLDDKLAYADFIIDNSFSLDKTKEIVKKAWSELKITES